MQDNIKLIQGDCLEIMKGIPNKSIDLALIDPPYNISKADWDKWKTVEDYVDFMGKVFIEIQRVLKDNGSFYFFHNDFLQIVELQNWINKNTDFIFKQFLVWNKRFNGSPRKYYFDNVIATNSARNHRQLSEYCLFYTFQDETGLGKIQRDINNYKPIKDYLDNKLKEKGIKYNDTILIDLFVNNGIAKNQASAKTILKHKLDINYKQFEFITEKHYEVLSAVLNFDKTYEDLRQEYEDLRQEYEDLRQEYEDLRYTFNNLKQHHDVLDFEVAKKQGHITPKPIDLLEYIIKTSSNEGDLVLDCFMGSGSTGVACVNTNRRFIGIEKDEKYFELAKERIEKS